MAIITNILFFAVLGRYILYSWLAGVSPVEAVICLLYAPVLILLLMSVGLYFVAFLLLVIAGLMSFSHPIKVKFGWAQP